ncbi:MAG: DNA gyrase C-terminal beta-propeller domain-containing protein, partial [Proteiniphilum sp.]
SVTAFVRVDTLTDEAYINSHYLLFCTKEGVVKKTLLEAYSRPRQNGVNAITIREEDQVISVRLTDGNQHVVLANRNGRAIRFKEEDVRPMGRSATGVKGMTLDEDGEDCIIGMICMNQQSDNTIMVVSEQGYGKRTRLDDEDGEPIYRITRRGGKGVKTLNVTEKTGKLVAIKSVSEENDLMIINKSGITIRMNISDIRTMGRATQGVRLINLEKRNDQIASVCKVNRDEMDEEELSDEPNGTQDESDTNEDA